MSQAIEASVVTADEFLAWPDDGRYELVDGQVVPVAPSNVEHGAITLNVGVALKLWLRQHGRGIVACNDPGIVLTRGPDTVRAPDVAVFLSRPPGPAERVRFVETLPDLVVEVASPSDRHLAVLAKANVWLSAGVTVVWVLWPKSRQVAVLRADEAPEFLKPGDTITDETLLPGFTLRLEEVFQVE